MDVFIIVHCMKYQFYLPHYMPGLKKHIYASIMPLFVKTKYFNGYLNNLLSIRFQNTRI